MVIQYRDTDGRQWVEDERGGRQEITPTRQARSAHMARPTVYELLRDLEACPDVLHGDVASIRKPYAKKKGS